jgi:uncharacterized membrane protein
MNEVLADLGIDLEKLTKKEFTYFSNWKTYMGKDYGFAYAHGAIAGIIDKRGDNVEVHFYFCLPIIKNNRKLTEAEEKEIVDKISKVADIATKARAMQKRGTKVYGFPVFEPLEFLTEDYNKEE